MRADYHVHSAFSADSQYPMEEVVKHAIEIGLDEICFTDHSDYGRFSDVACDLPAYFREIKRCQDLYQNQITIKAGAEFGMQVHTIDQFEAAYAKYSFDFIILSCHMVNDLEFWNQDFQRGKTQAEYNLAYYQEIYDVMQKYDHYSVLGHLDAIKRDDLNGSCPFEITETIINKILRHAIAHKKGIEVNTSNFRYHLSDLTPCRDILKRYYDLGGKILTLGSDSHKEEHLAAHFPYVIAELRKIGYTHYCTFTDMEPTFHKLP